MAKLISWAQAFEQFQEIAEGIDHSDSVLMCEAWSDYTDSLASDGYFNALQCHHCPSYDDMGEYKNNDLADDLREILESESNRSQIAVDVLEILEAI